jgi:3-isopropylmalate dehydrogenase
MLPSASLGAIQESGSRYALYEPVHGSAPDIAGKNLANPLAMIGSLSMAFKYSFGLPEISNQLDKAIDRVLASNIRTRDIAEEGSTVVGTQEMVQALIKELENV